MRILIRSILRLWLLPKINLLLSTKELSSSILIKESTKEMKNNAF